jgi:hypothetical protein
MWFFSQSKVELLCCQEQRIILCGCLDMIMICCFEVILMPHFCNEQCHMNSVVKSVLHTLCGIENSALSLDMDFAKNRTSRNEA